MNERRKNNRHGTQQHATGWRVRVCVQCASSTHLFTPRRGVGFSFGTMYSFSRGESPIDDVTGSMNDEAAGVSRIDGITVLNCN